MGRSLWIPFFVSISVSAIGYSFWLAYQRKKRIVIPKKWIRVGKVETIAMYPIKSAKSNEILEAECTEHGLREIADDKSKYLLRDRSFIMYTENDHSAINVFKHKNAILMSCTSLDEDTVVFLSPNGDDKFNLKISSFTSHPKKIKICIFGAAHLITIDCGDELASWISRVLLDQPKGFRMGYFMADYTPKLNPVEFLGNISPKFPLVYKDMRSKDGGPYTLSTYMILGSSSVKEINDKLPEEDRFTFGNLRPNLVIDTDKPFVEDKWQWIKIGNEVVLKTFKPCTRCPKININGENGDMNKNFQPFKLLKTYRTVKQTFSKGHDIEGDKPALGVYAGLYESGRIKVGDFVYTNA